MNLADLTSKLEANKKPLAIAGAAGVAGLALMKRRQAGGDVGTATATGTTSAVRPGSSLAAPNGQVVYSSTGSDVYNAVQPQLSTIGTALNQLLADKSAPDATDTIPIATTIFSPNATGNYVRQDNGLIAEVQSDGSLFGLTGSQWASIMNQSGGKASANDIGSFNAPTYSTAANVAASGQKWAANSR